MTFREFINENREEIKQAYLKQKFNKEKLEDLMKKGLVYIQYSEPRSRGKIDGANIKKITNDGAIVDDKFGNKDVEISFDRITMATNIKEVKPLNFFKD